MDYNLIQIVWANDEKEMELFSVVQEIVAISIGFQSPIKLTTSNELRKSLIDAW